jgi:hypothetical protein
MNAEQLNQAKKKSEELLKYIQQTESIQKYIEQITSSRRISLSSTHNEEMWYDWEATYELIGMELIELLQKKLWERQEYLEKLDADDLIKP